MAVDKLVDSIQLDTKLTNIANAIREKTGSTSTMTIEEMPDEVRSIPSGGGAYDIVQTINGGTCSIAITDDTTFTLQEKSVEYTSNGTATVTPDSGYDGLSKVNVSVNVANVVESGTFVGDGDDEHVITTVNPCTHVLVRRSGGYVPTQSFDGIVFIYAESASSWVGYDAGSYVNNYNFYGTSFGQSELSSSEAVSFSGNTITLRHDYEDFTNGKTYQWWAW